jgi:hypothetical protein
MSAILITEALWYKDEALFIQMSLLDTIYVYYLRSSHYDSGIYSDVAQACRSTRPRSLLPVHLVNS